MSDALTTLLTLIPGIAKAGLDIAQTSDAAKRNAQLVEFQNAVIQFNTLLASIQNENAALARDKRDLEDQLARMNEWAREKQRYKLVTPYTGVTVYAVQKAMSNGEPPHYICANCYQNGKRSILQHVRSK